MTATGILIGILAGIGIIAIIMIVAVVVIGKRIDVDDSIRPDTQG